MRPKFRSCQCRSTFGAVTVMFALVALLGAGSASAAEVLDANCGDPTNPVSTGTGSSRVGQTFTALNTGQLTSATVSISKQSNDEAFSMQIRPLDGVGVPAESAASAIATETVPAPASNAFGPITANFSTPGSVVAGQQYALVLERASLFAWGGQDPTVPCDGDLWITNVNGWTLPGGGFDWAYSVFVTPPPPPVVQPATTAPTGQRAAALKKCKKKKSAKKRKKCKKKANLLPV